jgi:hypothetical protein
MMVAGSTACALIIACMAGLTAQQYVFSSFPIFFVTVLFHEKEGIEELFRVQTSTFRDLFSFFEKSPQL